MSKIIKSSQLKRSPKNLHLPFIDAKDGVIDGEFVGVSGFVDTKTYENAKKEQARRRSQEVDAADVAAQCEEAQKEADDLLQDARLVYRKTIKKAQEDAETRERKRKRTIVRLERDLRKRLREGYNCGLCRGYEEGYNLGLQVGREDKIKELNSVVAELRSLLEGVNQKQEALLAEYEDRLVDLAFNIARKVVKIEVDRDDLACVNVVKTILGEYRELRWVELTVPTLAIKEKLIADEQFMKKTVAGFKSLRIGVADDGEADDGDVLLVDTPLELIDASFGTQLSNIREKLKRVTVEE
ncbi:MAG: hypothetical protein LBJ38_02825 [Oscillospiraceae bacterium]|nr:hypothetical protein [Oscillospiraceae bacterium]